MTQDALTARLNWLTEGVVSDWRWANVELNVTILGMLLYGLARATAKELQLSVTDIDAAVLQCVTKQTGAAPKWTGGLVAEARMTAEDPAYHPGQYELVEVGETYHGVTDLGMLVNNVYANFASVRSRAGMPEQEVTVFLNPLIMLLVGQERKKGKPLTEGEVLAVRDQAACMQMPLSQAEKFYASLDAQMPMPRLNPQRIWEEWQLARNYFQ